MHRATWRPDTARRTYSGHTVELTVEGGQHLFVGVPQPGEALRVDVEVWEMRDEVVANEEPHQHPVVYDVLQTELKGQLRL